MAKKSAMGRGLDAIFESNSTESGSLVSVIRISDIEANKSQPRKTFDDSSLAELSQSIASHGVIQPIVVRSSGDGFYSIIAGERRFRAAKMAGLSEIPAIVRELDDKSAAEVAIIENIQRENLNPIEEAAAYQTLMDVYGLTQEELSQRVGKSRPSIANMLRILDLPDAVSAFVRDGLLSTGHAKALLGLKYTEDMVALAQKAVSLSLSVRETEAEVRKINASYNVSKEIVSDNNASYQNALKQRLLEVTGRKFNISYGKKKTVEISYEDNDDLEMLLKTIAGDDIFDF